MNEGILSTIGHTPLIRLDRLYEDAMFTCYAKLEGMNPGGSAKDRPARAMIARAFECGLINDETLIVESSSGNTGIGLAQVCCYFGLRFICVVDPRTPEQCIRIMETYGAEVRVVRHVDSESGEFLPARIKEVQSLIESRENTFWPDQYSNSEAYSAHFHTTMPEIVSALGLAPDFLFCATSTCGTIRGCIEYIQTHRLATRVVAVDSVGSCIFGPAQGERHLSGLGAGIRPPFCPENEIDQCVRVSDLECVTGCRRLVASEAILAGASSGGVVAAVDRLRSEIPANAICVLILADRGERYINTVYSDTWVRENLGDIDIPRRPGKT